MKFYGISDEHINLLRNTFEQVFGKKSDVRVYIFGSRATGKHKKFSDIDLVFKSRDKNLDRKISLVEESLESSELPYTLDLLNWDKILKEYKPEIKKQKIPFWSPDHIEVHSPWRVCPLGHHWVRRHDRQLKTGTIVDQDGHCRLNPSKKDILTGDEIDLISNQELFKSVRVRPSPKNLGFGKKGNAYDSLIAGWVAYWNSIFPSTDPLPPNIVKALIATESSFDPKARSKRLVKGVPARGLVQLTEATYQILRDHKGELKDHLVILEKEESWDPNKNICAAVRWIFRKRETAKRVLKRDPTWEEVIWDYKGILRDKSKEASKIRIKFESYLEEIK